MRIECKATQPQTLFAVWARQSSTNRNSNQYSSPTTAPIGTVGDSTITIDHSSTALASNSSLSNNLSNRNRVNYLLFKYQIIDLFVQLCHAQINVRKELEQTVVKLNNFHTLKSSNLLSNEGEKMMKVLVKQRSRSENKLKRLEQVRVSQVKYRRKQRMKLKKLIEKHPVVAKEYELALHDHSGQPRVEDRGQSTLLGS